MKTRITPLEWVLKHRWYPDVLRIFMLLGSAYLMYVLLFGNQIKGQNTGLSVMWILLWSVQPLVFIFLGRFFCAICPFSTAGDLVQKLVGNELHPPLFLKKYGVWFAYLFFILILVIESLVHMSTSTSASSILLLSIFTMAILSGAFFRKRTWCRYLCPLGVGGGVFSRLRVVKLSKKNSVCGSCREFECIQGTEKVKGCPMGLCIKKHDLDADCVSCGNCLKSCPNESPFIELRSPIEGFLSNVKLNQAEAVFTSCFVCLSFALYLIKDYQAEIARFFGFHLQVMNDVSVILLFTSISFSLFLGFSYLVKPITRQSHSFNFRFFGFFLIPYIFFALFNLTSVHEVFQHGMILYFNLLNSIGIHVPTAVTRPLISLTGIHLIQGLLTFAGSALSVYYCLHELNKRKQDWHSYKTIAAFSIFLLMIAGYSLVFLFLVK